jgi:hypothetical protein
MLPRWRRMVNFGYHLARLQGSAVRAAYQAALPRLVKRAISPPRELPFEVYSYSGEAALAEQVASIRSLLRHGGRPIKFVVVSDGSYSPQSINLLESIDRCVSVSRFAEFTPPEVSGKLRTYLTAHPTGKQLALIMSLPADAPALYIDSDVLFFAGASALRDLRTSSGTPAKYLADCQLSADERLLRAPAERENPVNTGVLFLDQKLDWSLGVERFRELADEPNFFTNQTITHLVMHSNAARPLDPATFVLQLDDQFVYRDHYAGPEIALRHYVNPVRHKFWTSLAR